MPIFEIKCETKDNVTLSQLRQFQGNLKKRSTTDVDNLIASIKEDGLLMPLAIWQHDDTASILDGHARYEAFVKMAIEDPSILSMALPCVIIKAPDEAEAKKALLQITSSYGHVTKKGLINFTASIPNYKATAPIVLKTIGNGGLVAPTKMPKVLESSTVVLRLQVPKDMVGRLTEVLKAVEGVVVL
jgi:hypothetical protein